MASSPPLRVIPTRRVQGLVPAEGFGGVPQFPFFFPQECGIKRVDNELLRFSTVGFCGRDEGWALLGSRDTLSLVLFSLVL